MWGLLNHCDICAVLPQVSANVVRRVTRTHHNTRLAAVFLTTGVLAGVMLCSFKFVGAWNFGDIWYPRHSNCEFIPMTAR
jgi:hypothetical protein